jgi:Tat protein translocase TatB subunit
MQLLIFESIGMSELILIGIVALIIFGPRKLPQMARKAGKTMNDLRKVTNEFKDTWRKEVDLSELQEGEPEKKTLQSPQNSELNEKEIIEMPSVSSASVEMVDLHRKPENKGENDISITEKNDEDESQTGISTGGKGQWF